MTPGTVDPGEAPDRARPVGRRGGATLAVGALLLASMFVSCAVGTRTGEASPGGPPPADTAATRTDPPPSRPALEDGRPAPAELLSEAVTAADSSDPGGAVPLLEKVRDRCGTSPAGARAAILLAALHLDPRHAEGDPQTAAEIAAGYVRAGFGPAWTRPVARVLYLEALEKGASPPEPAGSAVDSTPGAPDVPLPPAECLDPDVSEALAPSRILPELPGTPMAERLEALQARVEELEKELERIRDVLDEP